MPAPNVTQLNHVAIHVADAERSAAFYREVLGLQPMPQPTFDFPVVWLRIGKDQELHIIGNKGRPLEMPERSICHTALAVEDIEAAKRHLEEKGIDHRGVFRRPDGAAQLFLNDPDGHRVELTSDLPG